MTPTNTDTSFNGSADGFSPKHSNLGNKLRFGFSCFIVAAASLLWNAEVQAIEVQNTSDSGAGSLRQAIADAQAGDTITFHPSLNGQTILLTSGELVIGKNLTILGHGADLLAIDGNALSRVFYISPGNTVTIAGLTVTNGNARLSSDAERGGGGIYNDHSTLTLSNCTVTGNEARGGGGVGSNGEDGAATMTVRNCIVTGNSASFGGGIWSFGWHSRAFATVIDSAVCNNTASDGGGVYNDDDSDMTIIGSTICDNTVDGRNGGGIVNDLATLAVMFSTLSGNSAEENGGAIYNSAFALSGADATAVIVGCTLSGNSAGSGGGIYNQAVRVGNSCSLSIVNCTLSGNSASDGGGGIFNVADEGNATLEISSTILDAAASGENLTNYNGVVTSLGYNLSTDSAGGFLSQPTDLVNTNPLLGPLQNNGGPTFTHALLCGSPAIDRGKNLVADSNIDQRGLERSVGLTMPPYPGDGTDIGAFEAQTLPACNTPPVANCKNVTVSADSDCTADASINNGSSDPDAGDSITLTQNPPGPYPLGTTSVTLTVADSHGATNSCVATVTVVDDTPPTITCPPDQTANATSSSGVAVNYPTASASDACGPLAFNYSKDSGMVFPIGDTIVSVTVTDIAGLRTTCSFKVHVKGSGEQINELIKKVNGMTSIKVATRNALLVKLQSALSAANSGNKTTACDRMTDFINLVKAQKDKKLVPPAVADELMAYASQIKRVLGCQ